MTGHYLIIIGRIRLLNGTLTLTSMFFILIPHFGWLLSIILVMFLVKVARDICEPFYSFDASINQINHL